MRHARLRGRDRGDLARIQVNAVAEHGMRGEYSAFLINVGVIARVHIKMMNLLELLAVFGEMSLEISVEPRCKFGRATHHFFRTSNGETRAERIFESAIFGTVPFSAKTFAFKQRNGEDFLRLKLSIRADVHHHLAKNCSDAAVPRGFESDLAAVFVDRGEGHNGCGPVTHQLVTKLLRTAPLGRPRKAPNSGASIR